MLIFFLKCISNYVYIFLLTNDSMLEETESEQDKIRLGFKNLKSLAHRDAG